ncbi:Uncharacterised protein [Mycobacteroides abscessus subsp. massiliense]|nr:Uncharacterised protein [Mycobacteroides abscessus subsp. massiliense]
MLFTNNKKYLTIRYKPQSNFTSPLNKIIFYYFSKVEMLNTKII